MNQIPNDKNKINALQAYLEANKYDDEGDSWILGHIPTLKNFMNTFNKAECDKLCAEIWNWNEQNIFNLADIFLEVSNPHIDSHYMYGQIFLRIDSIEDCEYLIENMQVLNDKVSTRPKQFYLDVLEKIKSIGNKIDRDFSYWLGKIEEILKNVR